MQRLNFPEFDFRIEVREQKKFIFDKIRKKFIPLTPEEWVRQHCIEYLIQFLQFPITLLAVERKINTLNLNKRFDIVAFNSKGEPEILIECKAPEVTLNSNTLMQIAVYNKTIHSGKLWITNGINHYWFQKTESGLTPSNFPHLQ